MNWTDAILLEDGTNLQTEDGSALLKDAVTTPTLAQSVGVTDTGFVNATSIAAPAFGSPLVSGSKLLAFAMISGNTTITFSDPAGNTWNTLTVHYWANVGYALALGWADNTHGATSGLAVTATFGLSGPLRAIAATEWLGLATGAPDTSTAGTNSVVDPATDASMTTTQPNDLVVVAAAGDQPMTGPGAGFTALGSAGANTGAWWEYLVKAAAGAITPTMDQAGATQTEIISAAFKAA